MLDNGFGDVTGTTSITVNPTETTTYTLTAANSSGSGAAEATVTVNPGTLAPDTTAPLVSIVTPSSGDSLSSTPVTISANASDPVISGHITSGMAGVQFRIDGQNLGSAIINPPYSVAWDTSAVTAGSHVIDAIASDAAGNAATSAGISVTVNVSGPRSYSTVFPNTENPISEGGNWINGKATGLDWADIRSTSGLAFGTESGSGGYDDSTAVLSGSWGPNQTNQSTVHTVNQNPNIFEEVELRLRTSISAHSITGYEINFRCTADGSQYAQIVRWNGPLSDFTLLDSRAGPGLRNGDVIKATIVGNVITAYINGAQVVQVTDSTYSNGSPGMGFYLQNGSGVNSDYGFTSFSATSSASASPDTNSPSTPSGLLATAISASQINLSWNASTDNIGVVGYTVYRNGAAVGNSGSTSYSDVGLSPATSYTYRVAAYDAAGNISTTSSPATASTLASPVPVINSFSANPSAITAGQTSFLSWNVSNATGLSLNQGIGDVTGLTSISVSPSATKTYMLTATNNSGSAVAQTTITVSVPDTTAPSTPTGLSATAISSTQINLSWTASTDNIGVVGYRIYRAGTQVGTSAGTTYSDSGLSPSTSYSYTVSAYDAAGNNSPQSSSASATTLSQAGQSWAHVQTTARNSGSGSNPLAFGSATRAGDLIIVEVDWSSASTFVSLSDTQGNVYTEIGAEQNATSIGIKSRLYYAKNIKGGADTVTTVVSGSPTYHELYIHEYSGLSTTSPMDTFSVSIGSGSSFTSGNVTTTVANELVYGIEIDSNAAKAASGWTTRSAFDSNVAADKNVASVGTASFTGTSGGQFLAWIAAFK